jgi:hypothetical protein
MLDEKIFLILGYLLFCIGTILGIPHGISKGKGDPAHTELWRVAHLSTCIGGISIIVLQYVLKNILPEIWVYALVAYSSASYLFAIACMLSAKNKVYWYKNRRMKIAKVIYSMHIVASCLSMIAIFGTLGALFY